MLSFRNGLLLFTAPLLLAHAAHAQSPSCELLKQALAGRIPPEIKGYSMDDVPARTPVPSGGKVIGTCEGGARKVIYRRFGGPPLVVDGAGGTAAATPTTPAPGSAPAPAAVQPKEAPKPKPEPVVAPKPVPPKPVLPTVASAPVASATVVAPAAPPAAEKPAEAPAVALSPPPVTDDEPGFLSTYATWLWLLLALPLVAWVWAWVSHRMAYDEAGLPRGPRL